MGEIMQNPRVRRAERYEAYSRPNEEAMYYASWFDGGTGAYISRIIIISALSLLSFGLYAPWGICAVAGWKARRSYLSGRPLEFSGTGESLFSLWMKFLLPVYVFIAGVAALSIIYTAYVNIIIPLAALAALVYSLVTRVNMMKWVAAHTHANGRY